MKKNENSQKATFWVVNHHILLYFLFSFEMQHNFLADWQIFRFDFQEKEQLEKEIIILSHRIYYKYTHTHVYAS